MVLKNVILLLLLGFITQVCLPVRALAQKKLNSGLGFGFQLNQYQGDFGFGLNVTSPIIFGGNGAIRLKTNQVFFEHIDDGQYRWSGYQNVSLGVVGFGGKIGDGIRLYGEGGLMGIFPSKNFSSENFRLSSYGTFGLEFFPKPSFNYFIELGVVTSQARADKVAGNPFYSNGFVTSVGFRINLNK